MVDAGIILGKNQKGGQETPYIILLKWGQHNLGVVPDRIVGIKWIEEARQFQAEHWVEGLSVKVITPEAIWKLIADMDYGPRKV